MTDRAEPLIPSDQAERHEDDHSHASPDKLWDDIKSGYDRPLCSGSPQADGLPKLDLAGTGDRSIPDSDLPATFEEYRAHLKDALDRLKVTGWMTSDPPVPIFALDQPGLFEKPPSDLIVIGGNWNDALDGNAGQRLEIPPGMDIIGWMERNPPIPMYGPKRDDARAARAEPPTGMDIIGWIEMDPPIPMYGFKPPKDAPKAL